MKQRLTVLATLLLMINQVLWPQSQNHFVWLRLSDERIIINAQFEQISTDSLIVLRGGRMTGIPLEEIIQIRVIREVSIINGMFIGAGAGIVAGAVIGAIAKSSDPTSWSPAVAAFSFAIVGGVVGSVVSSFGQPGDVVDLKNKTAYEKREIILKLLSKE